MRFLKRSVYKYIAVFFLVFLFAATTVSAQEFSFQFWHPGSVVTIKKDTLKGEIKYDMEANSVQVRTPEKVHSFSSHSLIYCEFYDKTIDNTRKLYSIPYEVNKGFKSRILFELLFEGPTSLLSREKVVQETINSGPNFGGMPLVRDRLLIHFFFLNNKGEIRYYSGKRTDLLELMGKKSSSVKSFIRQNKLKTDEVRDLIRIIAFYNSI